MMNLTYGNHSIWRKFIMIAPFFTFAISFAVIIAFTKKIAICILAFGIHAARTISCSICISRVGALVDICVLKYNSDSHSQFVE